MSQNTYTDNAFMESFNGRLRNECLKETLFSTLAQARATLVGWAEDYSGERPCSRRGWLTPAAFAAQWRAKEGIEGRRSAASDGGQC